ncbi:WYL domain-containing protein [Brevibacterium sp. 2SA]|uniref:helix-turn-helix transcriptional regulator n=1 Tax=Brevibacterium sp. 2SA TaxID=2502198 RepID=UPI0010F62F0A|nr:WYL domain-containing protein [Brevibacterium sp. 2SA]
MKAARLVSEIALLSARSQPLTASDLATRLEVTVRTIYRDLAELSRMGVPIVTESGPGGGVSLLGEWTSPLSGLTRTELDSVLLGSFAAADLGLSGDLATARAKISAAGHEDLTRTVIVDGPDWFAEEAAPPALDTVATALRRRRGLRFAYPRAAGTRLRRVIPLGLVVKAGRWYLVAQPPGGAPRTYRVSRITDARLHWTQATGPTGFDLGDHWQQARIDFDRSLRTLPVRIRLAQAACADLVHHVPGPLTAEAVAAARPVTGADGVARLEVDIALESVEVAVSQLLTVPGVEVVSPATVREKLARRACELLELNRV